MRKTIKNFMASILFLLIIISVLTTMQSSVFAAGDRTNPYSAYKTTRFEFQKYSFDQPKVVELTLMEVISGANANEIIKAENMFNEIPALDEQWLLFKFNLKYISGPEEELAAYDIINNNPYSSDFYFSQKYTAIAPIATATLGDSLKGNGIFEVKLYPGSEGIVYAGALLKTNIGYPLFRIKHLNDYYWFSTDPSYAPVKAIDLASSNIKINDVPTAIYTSKEIKPTLTVKNGSALLKLNSDYTLSYSNNKNVGKATVTIVGKGNYTGKKIISFNIAPQKVSGVKVASSTAKKATVSWSKATGATGYQVYYSTSKSSGFKSAGTTKNLSLTKSSLTKGKIYYFKVVAYVTIDGKNVYGPYSDIKSVKVK